ARTDLHHMDRSLVVSHSNARDESARRSDLVEVAQGDQAFEETRIRNSSSARYRSRYARALRSSRSAHLAQSRGRSTDRGPDWRWQSRARSRISHRARTRLL